MEQLGVYCEGCKRIVVKGSKTCPNCNTKLKGAKKVYIEKD